MPIRNPWITAGATAVFLMMVGAANGQTSTATLTGVVTDPTSAAIVNAQIQIRNQGTSVVEKTLSGDSGGFSFNFLPVGTYDLMVQAPGFQSLERKGLLFAAGQTLRLDLQLQVGGEIQSITVSGQEPLVQLSTSDQLHTITNRQVVQLPTPKLDWSGLMNLGTGMAVTSAIGSTAVAMNGMAGAAVNFTVDGTSASSNPEQPSFGFYNQPNLINTVNMDAIEEVSVVKGIIPASVSGTLSGNVNIITKSGSNEFHGDAFELNAVSALNARNQFLSTRPRSTFNQFGGALGGPIVKGRLFFFGSYEGARLSAFRALTGTVPTPYLISMSPSIFAPIFGAYPKAPQPANATALTTTFTGTGSTVQNDHNGVGRLDYYLTPGNQVSFRYTRAQPFQNTPSLVSINPREFGAHDDMYNAEFRHSAGAWTSSTRFGWNHLYFTRVDKGFDSDLQGVAFSGFNSGGSEFYVLKGNTYTGVEDVAYNRGRHMIKFGGIAQRLQSGRLDLNTATFSYSSLADFQANIPSNTTITFDVPEFSLHTYQYGAYVQDDFKVSSAFTLNIGMRYDYFTVPKERDGRLFSRGVDPKRPTLGGGFGPYSPPDSLYKGDFNNFAPRLGFAWALDGARKTVLRGGSGVFVSSRPLTSGPAVSVTAGPNIPFRSSFNRAQALAGGLGYPLLNAQFLPTLKRMQDLGVISREVASNNPVDFNNPQPYSIQWMLAVERELGFGSTLSVGYVANRSLKLTMRQAQNYPDRLTGRPADPTFSSFFLNTPLDSSTYHSLQTTLRKRFSRGLTFEANFTHASNTSLSDASVTGQSSAQDSDNLRADHGPTPFQIRNNFNGNFIYELPFARWAGKGRAAGLALGGWQLSGIVFAHDGGVVNIVNSSSAHPGDRADLVYGAPTLFDNYGRTLRYLNRAAFAAPPIVQVSGEQARPGTLGRNALYGPGMWNLDASVRKSFLITERVSLRLKADFLNAFNHTNLGGLVSNVANASFGQLTSASARTMQIGARIQF
jgi:hypothetical protein